MGDTTQLYVIQEEKVAIISDRGIAITNPRELGELLRKKRKSQGLTQGRVAEYCGVSVKFISEVERGKETAEIGKVLYLLNTLGIDLIADTRE
ncbi:MAG: type II toxin-antitoxin system Y4mF family antitoxin [Desulfuromonadales bacterium]|nr:type II toxin-antitoxin system Y4mF family antitoxin [Desulfuromonadales bacterium]